MIETMGKPYKDIDEAVKHILDDVQNRIDEAYQRGLEEGKKAFDLLDAERDSEYQRGLDDAWEAARELYLNGACKDLFGEYFNTFIKNHTAQEAIEKLKAYEEKQKADDEIKVGDEVIYNEHKFVVFTTENEEHYASLFDVNGRHASASQSKCKKTGRHFDIQKILEEMKE